MDSFTQGITLVAIGKGIDFAYHEVKKLMKASKEIATIKALNEQKDLIRILEKKLNNVDKRLKNLVTKNLQEPDTSLIINNALTGTYQYSDALKTEVLAEMIWARLTTEDANDIKNQIVNECISKIEKLSKVQLNILAIAYKLELSEDLATEEHFEINYYEEWLSRKLTDKYFFERNCIGISKHVNEFGSLDTIKMIPEDIYFIKAAGLGNFVPANDTLMLHKSFENTLKKYNNLSNNFLKYYNDGLINEIEKLLEVTFTEKFFRMNLNFSGLYLGEHISNILGSKSADIRNSREAKAKYNQEQYERFNAGLLNEKSSN